MNFSGIPLQSFFGKILRFPLQFLPEGLVVPIIQGKLRGYRWLPESSNHGCWLGSYEYAKINLFEKMVAPGSTVYDIGAHVGYYTLMASVLVGPTGKVYAFEPLPRNLHYLRKHLSLNKIQNVQVIAGAVSDTDGTLRFQEGGDSSTGRLSEAGDIVVATYRLDNFVKEKNLPLPDYLKIDVEGAELKVLQGSRNILRQRHPVIFLATHGEDIHKECCAFLTSCGYTIRPIADYADEVLAFV